MPLERIPFIGDSATDVAAAQAVDAVPILVRTGKGERTLTKHPELEKLPLFQDLASAVDQLLHAGIRR